VTNAIFIALVMLSVFFHVAEFPAGVLDKLDEGKDLNEDDMDSFFQYRRNLGGVTLHFSN